LLLFSMAETLAMFLSFYSFAVTTGHHAGPRHIPKP